MARRPYQVPTGRPECCHWCGRRDGTHDPACEDERAHQATRVAEARAMLRRSLDRRPDRRG